MPMPHCITFSHLLAILYIVNYSYIYIYSLNLQNLIQVTKDNMSRSWLKSFSKHHNQFKSMVYSEHIYIYTHVFFLCSSPSGPHTLCLNMFSCQGTWMSRAAHGLKQGPLLHLPRCRVEQLDAPARSHSARKSERVVCLEIPRFLAGKVFLLDYCLFYHKQKGLRSQQSKTFSLGFASGLASNSSGFCKALTNSSLSMSPLAFLSCKFAKHVSNFIVCGDVLWKLFSVELVMWFAFTCIPVKSASNLIKALTSLSALFKIPLHAVCITLHTVCDV